MDSSMKRNTNLEEFRKHIITTPFAWGESIRLHEVGPYSILEFHPWKTMDSTSRIDQTDTHITHFHGWINCKDTNMAFNTLDDALAGLIAYRHNGPYSTAGHYFMQGLDKV